MTNAINVTGNSIVQTERPSFVSDNYGFIPTMPIIELVRKHGWHLVESKQVKAKKVERIGFTKHQLIFEHPTLGRDKDSCPRIYITNSHDRTSAFTFNLGFFRFVCDNGLILGEALGTQFKVYHTGKELMTEIELRLHDALAAVPKALEARDKMRNIQLTHSQQIALAGLITKELAILRKFEVDESYLLIANRYADEPNDAWTVFNKMQENALGAMTGIKTVTNNLGIMSTKRVRARSIKSLATSMRINTRIFPIALNYLGIGVEK